jgi:hypothetical protein
LVHSPTDFPAAAVSPCSTKLQVRPDVSRWRSRALVPVRLTSGGVGSDSTASRSASIQNRTHAPEWRLSALGGFLSVGFDRVQAVESTRVDLRMPLLLARRASSRCCFISGEPAKRGPWALAGRLGSEWKTGAALSNGSVPPVGAEAWPRQRGERRQLHAASPACEPGPERTWGGKDSCEAPSIDDQRCHMHSSSSCPSCCRGRYLYA